MKFNKKCNTIMFKTLSSRGLQYIFDLQCEIHSISNFERDMMVEFLNNRFNYNLK